MHDSKKGFIKFLVSTVNTGKFLHTIVFIYSSLSLYLPFSIYL